MMTLWHGNTLHITAPLWGESTSVTDGFASQSNSNAGLWYFIISLLTKQSSHHYILTQWRPCDVTVMYLTHRFLVKILPLGRQMKHMKFEKITISPFLSSNIINKAAFLKLTDRCQIGFVLKYHYVVILRCASLFCWQYLVKDFGAFWQNVYDINMCVF